MKPYRLVETPGATYIADGEETRILSIVTKRQDGTWLPQEFIDVQKQLILDALNTYTGHRRSNKPQMNIDPKIEIILAMPSSEKLTGLGKPVFPGDNPNFVPGKHCTTCRTAELTGSLPHPVRGYTCEACWPRIAAGKKRSASAKEAVATKRRVYKKWPGPDGKGVRK